MQLELASLQALESKFSRKLQAVQSVHSAPSDSDLHKELELSVLSGILEAYLYDLTHFRNLSPHDRSKAFSGLYAMSGLVALRYGELSSDLSHPAIVRLNELFKEVQGHADRRRG